MNILKRRLLYVVAAVAFVLAFGTVGYTVIAGYPPFDAFYMTLTTIATVGYREIHELDTAGRVFNSFVILIGVSTIFFAIGLMTQTIVELEFGEYFGKRRTKRMIEKLSGQYIVCGYGRVGRSATMELKRAGVPIVVVDRNPEKVERAVRAGVLAVAADSTNDQTLIDVGVNRAAGLIAALATDADNLFLILSAKSLNPVLKVAARAGEEAAEQKLRHAGADTVYAPYTNAGQHLALSLVRPHVIQFLGALTQSLGPDVGLEEVRVADTSEFADKSLRQVQLRRDLGIIVLAIRRAEGTMLFNPPADAVLGRGDYLVVMGEHESLRKAEALLAGVHS